MSTPFERQRIAMLWRDRYQREAYQRELALQSEERREERRRANQMNFELGMAYWRREDNGFGENAIVYRNRSNVLQVYRDSGYGPGPEDY